MKIALVGYGRMGHIIEETAMNAEHDVVATIDTAAPDASVRVESAEEAAKAVFASGADGIIEFTSPGAVVGNLRALLPLRIPLVVGTTGWDSFRGEIASLAASCGGTVMTSANFSIGVNMFYKIVEEAARLVNNFDEYDVAVWEMHHARKADSPSGTALEIARRIIGCIDKKDTIVTDRFERRPDVNELHVSSTRCGTTPGTHKVFFDSAADTIELTHTARSRQGFASGAVHALENLVAYLKDGTLRSGALYGMGDVFPNLF